MTSIVSSHTSSKKLIIFISNYDTCKYLYISGHMCILIDLDKVAVRPIATGSKYVCSFVRREHVFITIILYIIRTFNWNRYRITSHCLLSCLTNTSINTLVVRLYTVNDMSYCHFSNALEFSRVFELVRTHRNLNTYKCIKY